jgi:hypothetical protein
VRVLLMSRRSPSGLSFSNIRDRELLLYLQAAAAGGMMANKRMRLSCVGHERAGKTTLLRCMHLAPAHGHGAHAGAAR